MTTTSYRCVHVWERTYEWVVVDLDGRETTETVGLCALCGRYLPIEKETHGRDQAENPR